MCTAAKVNAAFAAQPVVHVVIAVEAGSSMRGKRWTAIQQCVREAKSKLRSQDTLHLLILKEAMQGIGPGYARTLPLPLF